MLDGEELQLEGVLGRRCTLPVAEACVQRLADPGFEAPCLAAALTETGAESREGDTQLLFTSRQMEELEALEQHGGILKSDALLPAGPTRALLPPDPPHPAREGAFPVSKVATPALAALLVGATPPLQMEAEAHARALAGEAELKGGSLLPRGTSPLGLMAFTPPVGPDSEPVKAETPQWEEGKAAEGAVSTDNHLQPVRIEEGQAHQPQHSDGLVKHEFQQPGLLGGNELNQMPLKIADERPVADGQQQQHAATEVTPQGGGGLWPGGDSVSPAGTGGAEPPAEPQAIPSGPSVSLQDPQIPVGGFSASLEDIGGWESAPASVQAADSCVAGGQQRHEGVGDAPRLDPASARGDLDPLEIQMSVGEAMFHDMLNML